MTVCCEQWAKAQENNTDSEQYGPLLRTAENGCLMAGETEGEHYLGQGFPGIDYCPWCGANVAESSEKQWQVLTAISRLKELLASEPDPNEDPIYRAALHVADAVIHKGPTAVNAANERLVEAVYIRLGGKEFSP